MRRRVALSSVQTLRGDPRWSRASSRNCASAHRHWAVLLDLSNFDNEARIFMSFSPATSTRLVSFLFDVAEAMSADTTPLSGFGLKPW